MNRPADRELRRGFTWVELAVVIAILGIMAALVLPSIRSAKYSAYRAQCMNNIRNVGIAIQGYATAHDGFVPPLTGGIFFASPMASIQPRKNVPAPWTVDILPYTERAAVYDDLSHSNSGSQAHADVVDRAARQQPEIYRCPSDRGAGAGKLSYVANVGMIPESVLQRASSGSLISSRRFDMGFNGYGSGNLDSGDVEVARALGVFRAADSAEGSVITSSDRLNLDQISKYDGSSQTVLLAENLNTRNYDPKANDAGISGWLSSDVGDIAFGICVPMQLNEDGSAWQVPLSDSPGGAGLTGGDKTKALVLSRDPVPLDSRINSNTKTGRNGQTPRPSSNHPGCVNMAFADGSCKVISNQIDPVVYAKLLTPMASKYGQRLLSDTDF